MVEDFLHFVWEHKLFNSNELKTTEGKTIVIHASGAHNFSSGPDFAEAQISIGDTKWVGSVEIHLKSSDWQKHGHSADPAYSNVILHVVFEDDMPILNDDSQPIPTLELNGRIRAEVIWNYQALKHSKSKIPCQNSISQISAIKRSAWLNRVMLERLERKANDVALIFNQSDKNWSQTFYSVIAACLGQNYNKLPMLELTRKLPFNIVSKSIDDPDQLGSLFLGVAGFLNDDFAEEYPARLKNEFEFLKRKNGLVEVSQGWKTGRVRPDNLPQRRLVQLAGIVEHIPYALSELFSKGEFYWDKVELNTPSFWNEHYTLTTEAKKILNSGVSRSMSDLIVINGHAPFVFFYGQVTGEEGFKEKALSMLEATNPESNKIVKLWSELGITSESALKSQALIGLAQQYCAHKKCVICNLGKSIISSQ